MQFAFGPGNLFAIPQVGDDLSPIHFPALQGFSLDIKFDTKTANGQNQFPLDVARGKGTITGKLTNITVNGAMIGRLFFGASETAGQLLTAVLEKGTPVSGTLTVTNGTTFKTDLGVKYFSAPVAGIALKKVVGTPIAGEYAVGAGGVYTFAEADANAAGGVLVSYTYQGAGTGNTSVIENQEMGTTVPFTMVYANSRNGKQTTILLNNCMTSDLKWEGKQDDYTVPEVDFSAFADGAGQIGTVSMAE